MPSCAACSVRQILRHESEPAAHHVAVRQDLLHHAAHQIDRNREADALGPAVGAVQHRGVDADQIAVRIDQRAAGIAEIDGGIGLDEILEGREPELAAAGGAHDALRHGLAQTVGIADGEHDIAHPQRVGAAQRHDRQVADGQMQMARSVSGSWPTTVASAMRPSASCTRIESAPAITCWLVTMVPFASTMTPGSQAALDALAVARPIVAEQLVERRRLACAR